MSEIRRLLGYITYAKLYFFSGLFLLALAVGLEMLSPYLGQRIIDEVFWPHAQGQGFSWQLLYQLLLALLLLGLGGAGLRYASNILVLTASNKMLRQLRTDVFQHIEKIPVSYFDNIPAGSVVSRITNDTEQIRGNFFINVVGNLPIELATMLAIYIALAFVSWQIALALLILPPLMFLHQWIYSKKASSLLLESRELNGQINGRVNELVKNMVCTQSFGQEEEVLRDFTSLCSKCTQVSNRFLRFDQLMFCLPYRFSRLAMFSAVCYLAGGSITAQFSVSVGFIYLAIEYIGKLFAPLIHILDIISLSIKAKISAQRVFTFLDLPKEADPSPTLTLEAGVVSFNSVNFSYEPGNRILNEISFSTTAGESIAFIGHTGSGKSSLINLLFRFYDPDSGVIKIDGVDISTVSRSSLRAHMGIVLQDPCLFQGTIWENISLRNPAISPAMAEDALRRVGGAEILAQLPDGIQSQLLERGKTISAGQRQLIAFARALVLDPHLLILDEATSSIDSETEKLIQRAIAVVTAGRSSIIIAHRLSTIVHCDRIFVLANGSIVQEGKHEDLVATEGIYKQMFEKQQR